MNDFEYLGNGPQQPQKRDESLESYVNQACKIFGKNPDETGLAGYLETLLWLLIDTKSVVPVEDMNRIQVLLNMLDGCVNDDHNELKRDLYTARFGPWAQLSQFPMIVPTT